MSGTVTDPVGYLIAALACDDADVPRLAVRELVRGFLLSPRLIEVVEEEISPPPMASIFGECQ